MADLQTITVLMRYPISYALEINPVLESGVTMQKWNNKTERR